MKNEIAAIAEGADMIVDGYAFTKDDQLVRVINLHDINQALVYDRQDKIIETSMDDIAAAIVGDIYAKNKRFLG